MTEHISRKELKQDKIKETFEHGAEAVISHGQFAAIVVMVAIVLGLGYGGWRFYKDRKTAEASGVLASKTSSATTRQPKNSRKSVAGATRNLRPWRNTRWR